MKISIIVPAYNEEKTIGETLNRVLSLSEVKNKEIIVVDDGSTDNTAKIVRTLEKKNPQLTLIECKKNGGKGSAVAKGIQHAKGEIVVIQDADLEYHPKDIPRLIKPIIDKEAKVVYGTRLKIKPKLFGQQKTPFLLHFYGNKFLSLVTSILYGSNVSDMETGYKIFDKSIIDGITLRSRSFDMEPEITAKVLKNGVKIYELPITTTPRGYDEGKKIRTFHDGSIALWTLVKYKFTD